LGVIVITKNERETVYNKFTCISEFLKQGRLTVCVALRKIFESQQFKSLNLKKFSIWSDKGKHFHNMTYLGFFHHLVSKTWLEEQQISEYEKLSFSKTYSSPIFSLEHDIKEVLVRYFVEYHGKFIVDSHFSFISYLMNLIKQKEMDVSNVKKLGEAFRILIAQNDQNKFDNENFQLGDSDNKKILHHIVEIEEEDYLLFTGKF
jgi:hypothetical protein